MKYAWMSTYLDGFDLNIMCRVLTIKKSSNFSWTVSNKEAEEQQHHVDYKCVEDLQSPHS